ncbi:MAG: histidine triad nucleotide-binding protein [Candidatus Magnetominusculus sp. LBB02]|nr:histidine triad nucleotide-binding protein [Candidatus Magnetominusculus sp. LBB02]
MDCLFCRIARKEIPAKIVYEDGLVLAFEDVNPQAPVHVLVIPKKHISTSLEISDKDDALIGYMVQAANKIARERGIAERGFRMVMNCNKDAGQSVFHIHMHVLGGRLLQWPPG